MVRPIDVSNALNSLQMLGQSKQRYADLEKQKRSKDIASGAGIGGALGGIVGSYYGGPAGGAAGGAIGSMVGGQIAGGGQPDESEVARYGIQGYQMGTSFEQRQNNQQFNTTLADTISNDPNATDQQKQFAGSLKESKQDPNVSMRQAQYLGIDPERLNQGKINSTINSRTIDRGISYYQNKQKDLPEDNPQYQGYQEKIDRLNSYKSYNLASANPQSIQSLVRADVPAETNVSVKNGKVIAETTDHLTNQTKYQLLGNAGNDKVYRVPYYDEKKQLKVSNYSDKEAAIKFANEKGSEVLEGGKSVTITNLTEAAKSANKKDVEYLVTQDLNKRRDAITRNLTRKTVTGETIPPNETQVDESLLKELDLMAETTTGVEKTIIDKQRKFFSNKIKTIREQATENFITKMQDINPDVATVDANIDFINKNGVPADVDKNKVLGELNKIRQQRMQVEQAQQEKQAQEEESKRIEEELKAQEVERKKREQGYLPVIEYGGKRIL